MEPLRPCPDSALLAAFLDGTLSDYERTAVVSHLAECPQCRAVAATVVEFREVEALDDLWEQPTPPVLPEPLQASGVTRWSREKTRAPALAIAAAATLAAFAVPLYLALSGVALPQSPQQAVSTLIDVAAEQRPMVARLSGASAYAPPPSRQDRSPVDDRARIQLITAATDVRSAYAHDYAAPSRRAIGVAALLTGDLDDAIATLAIAAAGAPDDTRIANDLAAAHYERAVRANRPDDLPAALSAVERVLYREPTNREALFNRALIITELGLRGEAVAAWQAYIAQDDASPWSEEARARMQALPATPRVEWTAVRDAFERQPDEAQALAIVRDHTSAAHDYVERVLFNRWLDANTQNDLAAAGAALSRIRLLADAFAQHVPDNFYRDAVAAIDRAHARGPAAHADAIAAHTVFLEGMRLMAQQRHQDSAPVLARAERLLAVIGSPFAARARVELATVDYYAMRYSSAATALPALKADAQKNGHALLLTRAVWIQGLVAFGLSNFAEARVAYEEMLMRAASAGDRDQAVMAHVLLANLHEMLGDAALAWRYRNEAAGRLDSVFAGWLRPIAMASAAGDASAGGHHAAALLFQSALLSRASIGANLEVQLRSQRARSLHALQRTREAQSELAKAEELLQEIADPPSRLRVSADVLGAEAEIFVDSDPARAARAAERALALPLVKVDDLRRARVHLQLARAMTRAGQWQRAQAEIDNGIAVFDAYRARPDAEFAVRATDSVWGLYGEAMRIALRRGDVARAFEYSERARARTPQERRSWGATTPTLADLQRSLAGNDGVLVLTQVDADLQIWLIRRDSVATHAATLTPSRAASLVSTHLLEMIGSATSPVISGELFDVLFRPLAGELSRVNQLVIVADAPYDRVAFAGLWDRLRGRYMVEEHRLIVAPSAAAYKWALDRHAPRRTDERSTQNRQAAILTGAGADDARSRTLGAELVAMYDNADRRHADATTAAQFTEAIGARDVVHIAARVVANGEYPGLSRLVVAEEPGAKYSGEVFARSLANAQVQASLVSLDGAGSVAANPDAQGTRGFARALVAAGVPAVVSTVTEIGDANLDATWLDFHSHYAAGGSAAESLRRAQMSALRESNRRPGPWATLTVFGAAQ